MEVGPGSPFSSGARFNESITRNCIYETLKKKGKSKIYGIFFDR